MSAQRVKLHGMLTPSHLHRHQVAIHQTQIVVKVPRFSNSEIEAAGYTIYAFRIGQVCPQLSGEARLLNLRILPVLSGIGSLGSGSISRSTRRQEAA